MNQLRAFDVSVWDNPCDPNHSLSIEADNSTVEMKVDGIVVYVDTRSPTNEELNTLPHVVLTSEASWDPSKATYNLQPPGVEYLDEGRTVEVVREDNKLLPCVNVSFDECVSCLLRVKYLAFNVEVEVDDKSSFGSS